MPLWCRYTLAVLPFTTMWGDIIDVHDRHIWRLHNKRHHHGACTELPISIVSSFIRAFRTRERKADLPIPEIALTTVPQLPGLANNTINKKSESTYYLLPWTWCFEYMDIALQSAGVDAADLPFFLAASPQSVDLTLEWTGSSPFRLTPPLFWHHKKCS